MGGWWRRAGLSLALAVTGCSLSGPISSQAIDYNSAVETAANTLLVRNVLRARDNTPLHFTSIPQIRGSLSLGVTQPGVFGPAGGGASNGAGVGVQALTSPSFDVAALDTQEFTRGLLEPIEPQLYRYFADRGYPEQMLVLLLFDSVIDPATGVRLLNDPRCWFERPDCPERVTAAEIEKAFLTTTGQGRYFFHEYVSLRRVGPPLSAAQARDPALLTQLEDAKLRLLPLSGARYQLFQEVTRQAVCRRPDTAGRRFAGGEGTGCGQREVVEPEILADARTPDLQAVQVQTRSVADIFRFLGNTIRVQEALVLQPGERVRCLAFPVSAPMMGGPSPEACLFHITRDPRDDLPSGTAFRMEYNGDTYRVPAFAEPSPDGNRGDYTLRVMALLTDLLNLKKNSSAIPSTRAVQLVR